MLFTILGSFLFAFLALGIARLSPRITAGVLATFAGVLAFYFGGLFLQVGASGNLLTTQPWVPELGIALSFQGDSLSLFFAALVSGIGALVFLYAGAYLAGSPRQGLFFFYLTLFMGSMLGVVLANNVITLFIFWELTSLCSYFLIGFHNERLEARKAALQALLVTSFGGLALLAGFVLLGQAGGSFELTALTLQSQAIKTHPTYPLFLALILLGAFTKSAQFPFHFWLPAAMQAPTPVSAYLHSATMVKAGIYLLARLNPILGGTESWMLTLTVVGTATMLTGAFLALLKTDLKQILAYSTIAALGLLMLPLAVGSPLALQAWFLFLLAHALYKGALFLAAGAIDHGAGTREIDEIAGLKKIMPGVALASFLAAFSMIGLPPFAGFIAKEIFYEVLGVGAQSLFGLPILAMLATALLGAAALIVGVRPFLGRLKVAQIHTVSTPLWLAPLVLAVTGLLAGLLSEPLGKILVAPVVSSVAGKMVPFSEVKLGLWHGWNWILLASLFTILAGFGIFALQKQIRRLFAKRAFSQVLRWGPAHGYEKALAGLNALASKQTRLLQSGYQRSYLFIIVTTTLLAVGFTFIYFEGWKTPSFTGAPLQDWILILIIGAAALAATRTTVRLGPIVLLGVVGYGAALIYLTFGAPDLAMTQFLVETLTVILFVFAFYRLPPFAKLSNRKAYLRDALFCAAFGLLITLLILSVPSKDFLPEASRFFAEKSVTEAHGRNIVNVILVDYRAFDTLGEITVLMLAALGVYALLRLRPAKKEAP